MKIFNVEVESPSASMKGQEATQPQIELIEKQREWREISEKSMDECCLHICAEAGRTTSFDEVPMDRWEACLIISWYRAADTRAKKTLESKVFSKLGGQQEMFS